MACLAIDPLKAYISGFSYDTNHLVMFYRIHVETKENVFWTVERSYSEFDALHKKLVDSQGLNLSLPPKKFLGSRDPVFVENRRGKLDIYLQNIIRLLGKNPPIELAQFLNLYDYEILFNLRKMSLEIFQRGEKYLDGDISYQISPYQLFGIKERMKLALPPLDSTDKREDFSHLIDFCTNVKSLDIVGSNIPIPKSTIVPNEYSMDLSPFKSLTKLTLKLVNVPNLAEVSSVRPTLRSLSIHNSNLISTSEFLLCDTLYKTHAEVGPSYVWPVLESIHLTNNFLQSVNDLGALVPKLRTLDLSFNQLENVFDITSQSYLEQVSYAGNLLRRVENLHLYFPNIRILDISQNQIESLDGFSKLYSLVCLNLSCNRIEDVTEVCHLSKLRVLESLMLTGNTVASSLDYRVRTLAVFGPRAAEIVLDNEKASVIEVDQIAIFQAIEKGRQIANN